MVVPGLWDHFGENVLAVVDEVIFGVAMFGGVLAHVHGFQFAAKVLAQILVVGGEGNLVADLPKAFFGVKVFGDIKGSDVKLTVFRGGSSG